MGNITLFSHWEVGSKGSEFRAPPGGRLVQDISRTMIDCLSKTSLLCLWLLAIHASLAFSIDVRATLKTGTYSIRLASISPGNKSVSSFFGWLDSGNGCLKIPSKQTSTSVFPTTPVLSSVFDGFTSSFELETAHGIPDMPSNAFLLRARSYSSCQLPSILSRTFAACPSTMNFGTYPSGGTYWVAEPVPKTASSMNLFYIKAFGLGKRCRNGKQSFIVSCCPQLTFHH